MTIYVLVEHDGELYGAYTNEDAAWYAWEEADFHMIEPQRVEVLLT